MRTNFDNWREFDNVGKIGGFATTDTLSRAGQDALCKGRMHYVWRHHSFAILKKHTWEEFACYRGSFVHQQIL